MVLSCGFIPNSLLKITLDEDAPIAGLSAVKGIITQKKKAPARAARSEVILAATNKPFHRQVAPRCVWRSQAHSATFLRCFLIAP